MKTEFIEHLTYLLSTQKTNDKDCIRNCIMKALQPYDIVDKNTTEIIGPEDTTAELLKAFCMYKMSKNITKGTIEQYVISANQLCDFVNKPLSLIKEEDIQLFLIGYKFRNNCTDTTMRNKYSNLKSLFETLYKHERIKHNPIANLEPPKLSTKKKIPLTDEEIEKIKDFVCDDKRITAMIHILLDTGCRVTEVVNIKLNDIDFTNRQIKVLGKGNKERIVGFGARTFYHLQKYLDTRNCNSIYLFCKNISPFDKLSKGTIEHEMRVIGYNCGIERLNAHLFRHTCATRLVQRGIPIEKVSLYLGHANINTTMRYVYCNTKEILDTVDKIGFIA